METKAFSELFPLFNPASPELLEWLLSIAEKREYAANEVILEADTWGRAVYLIVSGWVKIQHLSKDKAIALEILGRGDSFGEMAIIDEPLRASEGVALCEVELISISAQRFIQMLFKDPQVHHRLLQLSVRRLRQFQTRHLLTYHSTGERLAKTLVFLAENYGQSTEKGIEIFNVPLQDLADVANVSVEEARKIMEKLQSKGWIEVNSSQVLRLTNLKQLTHLAGQIV